MLLILLVLIFFTISLWSVKLKIQKFIFVDYSFISCRSMWDFENCMFFLDCLDLVLASSRVE
jgi:hypothetical protein